MEKLIGKKRRYIKTIKYLTDKQRCNWLRKNNPSILGTRRLMCLDEWLDLKKVPNYRITSQLIKY